MTFGKLLLPIQQAVISQFTSMSESEGLSKILNNHQIKSFSHIKYIYVSSVACLWDRNESSSDINSQNGKPSKKSDNKDAGKHLGKTETSSANSTSIP